MRFVRDVSAVLIVLSGLGGIWVHSRSQFDLASALWTLCVVAIGTFFIALNVAATRRRNEMDARRRRDMIDAFKNRNGPAKP